MMRNSLRVHKKSENHLYWNQLLADMARILLTAYSQSEFPEQQEKAPAAENQEIKDRSAGKIN